MADEQAASSVADVFNGQEPTLTEYNQYRESGELPARFKPAEPAESAPADAQEETEESEGDEPESVSDSEPEEAQEQPAKGAEKRIRQLLAKTKELERKLAAQNTTQPDSSSVRQPQPPQNYQEYRSQFKPSEFIAKYAEQNPTASYEDANAAMADHLLDVRDHFKAIEQRVAAERQKLDGMVSEARERYEGFDEVKDRFLSKTLTDKGAPLIPVAVLKFINKSKDLADVIYTIAENEADYEKFVALAKQDEDDAIEFVANVRRGVAESLAKGKQTPPRGENGQFKANAPEPKRTQAPKPPSPVGGGSARVFDVNDESLPIEEWNKNRWNQVNRKA